MKDEESVKKQSRERFARWYAANKAKRNEARRRRYHKDADYREKLLGAAAKRRPVKRAERAEGRFEVMVAENATTLLRDTKGRIGLPRWGLIPGRQSDEWLCTTRELALRTGRRPATIRAWLSEGVLPGCSISFAGDAYFTESYMEAVVAACRRVYYLDGTGNHEVLRDLVASELRKRHQSYVPRGGTESDRVTA